jgi:hypothetical protein
MCETCSIIEASNKFKNILTALPKRQNIVIMASYRIGTGAQTSAASRRPTAAATFGISLPPVLSLGGNDNNEDGTKTDVGV